jgi:TRAP-type C4-dicarboxylate transport system permease small subunit
MTLMSLLPQLTRRLSDVAALALVAMMLLTIADIVMKNLFHRPFSGTFELVEFLMVIAVFFGMPEVFRLQSNICVDLIDYLVKVSAQAVIRVFGALASLLFLLILAWAMLGPAWDTVAYRQNTQEIGIPLFAYWLPILLGTALMIVVTMTGLFRGRGDAAVDEI